MTAQDFEGSFCAIPVQAQDSDPGNLGVQIAETSIAVLICTTGSTGMAKGVMRSHRMLKRGFWLKRHIGELLPDAVCTVLGSGAGAASFIWFIYPLMQGNTVWSHGSDAQSIQNLVRHLVATHTAMLVAPLAILRLWPEIIAERVAIPDLGIIYTIGTAVLASDVLRWRNPNRMKWM